MPLQMQDLNKNRDLNNKNKSKTEAPDKAFESYRLDRPGKIIFVGHHLSTKSHIRCLIKKISLYGAEVEVSPSTDLPKNFFLEILGIHDEIGCTLMRRHEEKAVIGFNMLINAEFLHHVLKLNFETH